MASISGRNVIRTLSCHVNKRIKDTWCHYIKKYLLTTGLFIHNSPIIWLLIHFYSMGLLFSNSKAGSNYSLKFGMENFWTGNVIGVNVKSQKQQVLFETGFRAAIPDCFHQLNFTKNCCTNNSMINWSNHLTVTLTL